MMDILGTKPNGNKMTEFETAHLCLETIQNELEKINSSNGIREEIEILVDIANQTEDMEARRIMNSMVDTYQNLLLDVNTCFLKAKHKLDMSLLNEKAIISRKSR